MAVSVTTYNILYRMHVATGYESFLQKFRNRALDEASQRYIHQVP